jgi:hypothetical protein
MGHHRHVKRTKLAGLWWGAGAAVALSLLVSPAAFAEDTPDPPRAPGPRAPELEVDPQRVAELGRLRRESLAVRRSLSVGVVSAGLLSLIGGVVLVVPETDSQAMRVAGVNTLAFGVVNVVVGSVALAGIRAEEEEWEEERIEERKTESGFQRHLLHALGDERREAVSHGINLGLASAYGAAAITALLASQLGVDEPQRWRAAGVSIGAQALFLLVIDAIGTIDAGGQYRALEALTGSALDVAIGPDGGGVAFSRSF